MSKQINQYTKERDRNTVTEEDLIDLDSTDDKGSSYESAKIEVGELYQNFANTFSFYRTDGSFSGVNTVRTVGFNTGKLRFVGGGNVELRGTGLSDYGFIVQNLNDLQRAKLGTDDSLDTGILSLSDGNGEFLNASEGNVNIGGTNSGAGKLHLKGAFGANIARFLTDSSQLAFEIWNDGGVQIGRTATNPKLTVGGTGQNANNSFTIYHNGNTLSSRKAFLLINSDGEPLISADGDATIRFGNDISNNTGIGAYGFNGVGSSNIFSSRPNATVHIRGSESGTSFINEDGNSGFGITNPTAKLNVKGTGSTSGTTNFLLQNSLDEDLLKVTDDKLTTVAQQLRVDGNNPQIQIRTTTGGVSPTLGFYDSSGQFKMGFKTLYTVGGRFYIDSPSNTSFRSSSNNETWTQISDTGTIIPSNTGELLSRSLRFQNLGSGYNISSDLKQVIDSASSGSSNYLTFRVGSFSDLFVMNSDGNSGFGTTTPQAKLHVDGTVRLENLPTNTTGLVAGDIYNDGGTLKIV